MFERESVGSITSTLFFILFKIIMDGRVFIMCINDKVVFDGDIYIIIYDYKNGRYEIRNEQSPKKVHLVKESEIYAL